MSLKSYRTLRRMKSLNSKTKDTNCSKQFPDCPKQPNQKDCDKCSLWEK